MSNSKIFGYVRVSSTTQNIDRQLEKMKALGINERDIFIDKQSGKDFDRPAYITLKSMLRSGDIIYIDALDRLGRNYDGIIQEWREITRIINADIIVLENETLFDSRKFKSMGDMGKLMEDQFLSLLSYVAEQERNKIRQRQAEGIAQAKAQGKALGRPKLAFSKEQKELFIEHYRKWKAKEITAVEFARRLDVKKTRFYELIKEYETCLK